MPDIARLPLVDESVFNKAWENFSSQRFKNKRSSFTDHTILVQMKSFGIGSIASTDGGLDGLVPRIV